MSTTTRKVEISAHQYRGYFIVCQGEAALIYRDTAAGEGRPRVNELLGGNSYSQALNWIDANAPGARHTTISPRQIGRGDLPLPRFIIDDLGQGPSRYIIEHPSRGCFVGMREQKPRFRWSIARSHEGVKWWLFRDGAEQALRAMGLPKAYVLAIHHHA